MRSWWLRTHGLEGRTASRGALGLAVVVACSLFGACGGNSTSTGASSTGGAGTAGAGGSGVAGGAADTGASGAEAGAAGGGTSGEAAGSSGAMSGSSGATSGAAGATNGTGGQSGNGGAAANGGTSGAASTNGGAAGDGVAGDGNASAGESAGGSGGSCHDLCSESAPACCTEELRCVESVPRCRIDVLAGYVDTAYEYADLQAEIGTLSGAVEFRIPLTAVERAAADPAPAARFKLTLDAAASTDFAALTELHSQPFRLSCDEHELLVGVVYLRAGAAALRTPVMHAEQADDGALVLRLGAWQGAWSISGGGAPELRERLDRTELRAELCGRGILDELEL